MKKILIAFILAFSLPTFADDAVRILSPNEIKSFSNETKIKNITTIKNFNDNNGQHYLAFSTEKSSVPQKDGEDIDTIKLSARLVSEKNNKKVVDWAIFDSIDCDGLDIAAEFIPQATQVVDLNNTGEKSVVVGYKLFCGGGVDPWVLKIIYRNKNEKYALRGSTVTIEGIGGEFKEDKDFYSAPTEVKLLIKKTFDKVKKTF